MPIDSYLKCPTLQNKQIYSILQKIVLLFFNGRA